MGLTLWEGLVKELVVVVLNVLDELPPALPDAIALGEFVLNHCVSAGSCFISAISQEATMGSRGLIQKLESLFVQFDAAPCLLSCVFAHVINLQVLLFLCLLYSLYS